MSYLNAATAGLCVVSAFSTVEAQILDQFNNGNFVPYNYASYVNGQTFQPTAIAVAGAGFRLRNRHANALAVGSLDIRLWTALPQSGGTLMAAGTAEYTLAAGNEAMYDVFWNAVGVTPGTTYFLSVISPRLVTQTTDNSEIVVMSTLANTYANGSGWYDSDGPGPGTTYTAFAHDMAFEEFSAGPTTAPEPNSLLLVATGLAGVAGVTCRGRMRNWLSYRARACREEHKLTSNIT